MILIIILSKLCVSQERNLNFYIQSAIRNNTTINENNVLTASYNLRQKIARSSVISPNIFTTANYLFAPTFKDIGYDSAITNGGLYSALLNFDLPLFRGSVLNVKLKNTEIEQENYSHIITSTKHDIEKSVTDQYVKTYYDLQQIYFIRENLELLKSQRAIVGSLASNGLLKISDLKLLDIESQNEAITLMKQETFYRSDILDLNLFAGISDSESVIISKPNIEKKEEVYESNFMVQFRLDSLKLEIEQRQFELNYKPQLDFFINGGLNAVTYKDIQKKIGFSTGFNFTFSLYDGNQKELNGQFTSIKKNILSNNKKNFLRLNQIRKSNLLKEIADLDSLNKAEQLQVENYMSLLDIYSNEISTAQISVIDYINTLKNYYSVKNELLLTQFQRINLISEYNYWNW
jgi:outer membrane protein TolC